MHVIHIITQLISQQPIPIKPSPTHYISFVSQYRYIPRYLKTFPSFIGMQYHPSLQTYYTHKFNTVMLQFKLGFAKLKKLDFHHLFEVDKAKVKSCKTNLLVNISAALAIRDCNKAPAVAVLLFLLKPCCCLPVRSNLLVFSRYWICLRISF